LHGAEGATYFDASKPNINLDQEALDALSSKQKVKEPETFELDQMNLGVSNFLDWRYNTYQAICTATQDPALTQVWLNQIHTATSWEQLEDPPAFNAVGMKLAQAMHKILPEKLRMQISVIKQKYHTETGKFLNGRQIMWLFYEHHKTTEADHMFDSDNLRALQINGDNLEKVLD